MSTAEQTEGTEPEKKSPLGRFLFHFLIVVAAAGIGYLCSQQPKVWFDRQWAGLALYKGGYRSWTLSFCDGFTIAPGTYTNAIAKMVPVTIDEKTGTLRYGYHWPKYHHVDIRSLFLFPGTVVTPTNGRTRIDGAPAMPKDRPPRPAHVDADGNFFNPPDNPISQPSPSPPGTRLFNDALYVTNGFSVGIVTFTTNVFVTTNLFIIWEPPRQLVPQPRPVLNAADNFENPPENL